MARTAGNAAAIPAEAPVSRRLVWSRAGPVLWSVAIRMKKTTLGIWRQELKRSLVFLEISARKVKQFMRRGNSI